MRKWEDIIKEKMEEPDGELPESVFAEFHTRFDDAGSKHTAKRFPWMWALIPAVAAGLAAVLLLKKPEITEDGPQQVQQQPVAQIQTEESMDETFPSDTPQFFERTAVTKSVPHETISHISETPAIAEDQAETPESTDSQETTASPKPGTNPSTGNTPTLTTSPYIPLTGATPRVSIKVAPAAGGILGGSVLAALATYLTDSKKNTIPPYVGHGTVINSPSGQSGDHQGSAISSSVDDPDNKPADNPQSEEPIKDLLEQSTHYFPIKAGLSTRLPLTEKLFLTTGLEYSLYRSKFDMSYSGEKWQRVHYLGIPVRLDWNIASYSLFDVYVGGGMQGDFCLNATLAGKDIKKDRPSLSLVGAGGIQMNATKRLGFYLEPEFSWRIPNENNTLVTYRSEHPLMFSVSAGIRINLGNQ